MIRRSAEMEKEVRERMGDGKGVGDAPLDILATILLS